MTREERQAARDFYLARDLAHLTRVARRQALKAGRHGVTVENVRRAAQWFLPGFSDRGYQSRLWGAVMREAGLERVPGRYVRTQRIGKRGGNLVSLWRRAA